MAVWPISTVLFWTASSTCRAGTISPAAKTRIWNLLSVASATRLARYSGPPKSVSKLFGQLAAMRHLISGWDCAIAGAASAAPASPKPPVAMNDRRRIKFLPRNAAFSGNLKIAQPQVNVADRHADQHQAERVPGVGGETEIDPVPLGDPGHREVRRGADEGAVAAEAGAQ